MRRSNFCFIAQPILFLDGNLLYLIYLIDKQMTQKKFMGKILDNHSWCIISKSSTTQNVYLGQSKSFATRLLFFIC